MPSPYMNHSTHLLAHRYLHALGAIQGLIVQLVLLKLKMKNANKSYLLLHESVIFASPSAVRQSRKGNRKLYLPPL